MNIKRNLFILFTGIALTSSGQQINPITQAVLDSYQEILDASPNDYITLYQRGAQYYNLGMYEKALSDLEKAVKLTPEKDKDMRLQEFTLLSSIYSSEKNYNLALTAVDNALSIQPESYSLLYAKGNICLELKNPEEAAKVFKSMQNIKSRSQESLFGLARVAVIKGNKTEAEALMKEAENLDPSNYITHCRIGDINRELGDNQLAAANYLSAFALTSDEDRPVQSLIDLASDDYESVEAALNYALSKTTNTVPLNFLKGNIALASGNYTPAYIAFNELVSRENGRESGVYASLARTCLALDKPQEALSAINVAVSANPSSENRLEKARIERAAGNPASALVEAEKAYQLNLNNSDALVEMALANIDLEQYEKALANLNEAILTNPSAPLPLMIRAYVYADKLKNSKSALSDYKRVSRMNLTSFPEVTYKALAQTLAGDKKSGDLTMSQAVNDDMDATDYFHSAIYYSQSGDLAKGKEMLDRAKAKGYGNLYNLNRDKTINLNIAPIRYL